MVDAWDGLYGAAPALPEYGRFYRPPDPLVSSLGVFGRAIARQTIPTAGGVAAFPSGATAGGALGLPLDPFTGGGASVVLGGAGGLATSFGAGWLLEKGQRWALDRLTDGAYSRSEEEDVAQHPVASFVGGLVPQLAFMKPGGFTWKGALAGAAIGGGVEAGTEYAGTGTIDPLKVGAQTAFGGILQHNTRLGDIVQQPATMLAAGIKSGVGNTAARIGADISVARSLAEIPNSGEAVARAAATITDPNISQETRASMARVQALRSLLGDRMTPDEIAAGHVIEGDALTEASRPAGLSEQAHGEALTGALVHSAAGEPIDEPAQPHYSGAVAAAHKIIGVEAGGNPNARNPLTSASGLGQFTDDTWLRLYKNRYGTGGLSDAQILAKKTDPALATEMTVALTNLNAHMLIREDLPVTDTNVYLAHFLGPRALRVLKADAATPIADLVPHEFIEKNPRVLGGGKTAGDVIAWADRKMGGEGAVQTAAAEPDLINHDPVPGFDDVFDEPAPGADPFAGMDEGPATEAPIVRYRREASAIEEGLPVPDDGYTRLWRGERPDEGGQGLNYTNDLAGIALPFRESYGGRMSYLDVPTEDLPQYEMTGAAAPGAEYHLPPELAATAQEAALRPAETAATETRPARTPRQSRARQPAEPLDVLSFLAEHGGLRDDEGHDLQGRGRLISGAISGQRRRGGSAGVGLPVFSPRGGYLFRKSGMSIDAAGELLHEAGFFPGRERPSTADVIDLLASSHNRPVFRPEDMPAVWAAEQAARYGDPDGQHEQTASLEHDIRMAVEADPSMTVQLDGAGAPISVQRMLDELDAGDVALATLKACAAPGGEA